MIDLRLYLLQRISALIMVPLVLGHLAVMVAAIRGGLSAAEILGRTQGSAFWGGYYGLFVLAVSAHGSIGIRVILHEWLGWQRKTLTLANFVIFIVLLALGLRAVVAVTLP